MAERPFFYNSFSEKIYEVLESYQIAYLFSKDKKLRITVREGETIFNVNKDHIGGSDGIMFTIKYHPNMKTNNIEVYHINHQVLVQINNNSDLKEFIVINKDRHYHSRLGINGAVIFLDGTQRLQEFIAAIEKYF